MLSYIINYFALFFESTLLDGFLSVSCICAVVLIVQFLFSSKVVFE